MNIFDEWDNNHRKNYRLLVDLPGGDGREGVVQMFEDMFEKYFMEEKQARADME